MAAQAFSLAVLPRTMRLSVAGCGLVFLVYLAVSTVAGNLDANDQIVLLRASYASFVAHKAAFPELPRKSGSGKQRALIASGKEAAISLLQNSLQRSIEPPAKLESLHILDAPDDKGMVTVRASIRVVNLAPERVAMFIQHIEGTLPAIVFDDLRISIHTLPGVPGSVRLGMALETNSAEISGVVRVYATSPTDRLLSGTADGER